MSDVTMGDEIDLKTIKEKLKENGY